MEELQGKKVLLIASPYQDYYKKIAQALELIGTKVVCYKDEPNALLYYKYINSRFNNNSVLDIYYKIREKRTRQRILKEIEKQLFDYIIVIKGFIVTHEFLISLRIYNPDAKFILYQWDSVKSFDYTNMIKYFDKVFSFDYNDCKNNKLVNYLPLFYTDDYASISLDSQKHLKPQAFFLGVKHSNRPVILTEIADTFEALNFNYKFYLYVGFRGKIKSLFKKYKYISLARPKKIAEFREEYSKSSVIIDVSSPTQSGLPIRIIEAVGANKKIITTNINIKNEAFYNSSNVFIWGQSSITQLENFLTTPKIQFDASDYSIHSFVKKLITT